MPGVPSGRGCDACRKQKKKCDQLQPTCSRCARLRIECVGSGMRRFKFMDSNPAAADKTVITVPTGTSVAVAPQAKPCPPAPKYQRLAHATVPANDLTTITAAFVSRLEVLDPRYSIRCYGEFLASVPARLGRNPALDAAAHAMTTAFPSIYTHEASIEVYVSYSNALKRLRFSLEDPQTAHTAETLCAMYIVMIMQGWIARQGDRYGRHGEAITHLLRVAVLNSWQGDWEGELLVTLCVTSIIESIGNPNIQLEPWLSQLVERYMKRDDTLPQFPSLDLTELAKIPVYVRNPGDHIEAIREAYDSAQVDRGRLRMIMNSLCPVGSPPLPTRQYAVLLSIYGISLMLCICSNSLLDIFYPHDPRFAEDALVLYEEMASLGRDGMIYRPLGSCYVPLFLCATWATTRDPVKKAELEAMVEAYQPDFPTIPWMTYAPWLEDRLNFLREGVVLEYSRPRSAEDSNDLVSCTQGPGEPCCIL